jgi:hypothetical protein
LKARSGAVAAERRVCDGIEVGAADPSIGMGLGVFASVTTSFGKSPPIHVTIARG